MSTDGEEVVFEVKNAICRHYGATRLSCKNVGVDDHDYLLKILRGAANFFRLLDLSNMGDFRDQHIHIKCLQVCEGRHARTWIPKPNAPNLNSNNKIYINSEDIDKGQAYGFEIKNDYLAISFHAAVFFFDVHNLSIIRYDLPIDQVNSSSHRSTSLPAGQVLRIGCFDSGSPPRTYKYPPGQETDIGFLKLYLSSEPNKYSSIAQDSPFNTTSARGEGGAAHHTKESFETYTLAVIQGPLDHLKRMGLPQS
ncbi:hypothetical protein H0H93_014818 [Arthromyces matolae]|nr:hypothetical protein H0H93_014818 [Arthromyces matolae]